MRQLRGEGATMTMTLQCQDCGNRWTIERTNYDYSCPRCAMVRELERAAYQRGQRDAERLLKAREVLAKIMQPCGGTSGG